MKGKYTAIEVVTLDVLATVVIPAHSGVKIDGTLPALDGEQVSGFTIRNIKIGDPISIIRSGEAWGIAAEPIAIENKLSINMNGQVKVQMVGEVSCGFALESANTGDVFRLLVIQSAGGTGSGGTLIIRDEGVIVSAGANTLDIVGTDHNAIETAPGVVTIYSPSVAFASHYNTNDGAASCIVSDIATITRYIASPTAEGNPYKIGGWVGGTQHGANQTGSPAYDSINTCSFADLTTTIEVNIYDADGVAVLSTKITPVITGNYDNTSNNIRIQVTNWAADYTKYKGRIIVTITISAIIAAGGRYSIEIIHHDTGIDYDKTQNDIFYDINPLLQAISGATVVEGGAVLTKYLSGVKYYILNSQFQVDIADIDNLNSNTYPTTLVVVTGSEYGLPQLNLASGNLTGWTNAHDDIDDTYQKTNWAINQASFRSIITTANILARVQDWSPGASAASANASILIDTYTQQSNELAEYFTDEAFRRTSAGVIWDGTQSLVAYDGGTAAQVINGILKDPDTDFSGYVPAGNPNYTAVAGKNYYRRIIDLSALVRNSANLSISGFNLTDLINEGIKIWIDIPGRFISPCYVHGAAEYDFATFTGNNDPIRVNSSTANSIDVSFGTLGLDPTHTYFILHLIIEDNTIEPSSIVVSW